MTIPEPALQRNTINSQAILETGYCPKLFVIGISFNIRGGGQTEQTKKTTGEV